MRCLFPSLSLVQSARLPAYLPCVRIIPPDTSIWFMPTQHITLAACRATPRHATPRHATPRYATQSHNKRAKEAVRTNAQIQNR
ncbi:hypothetical protein COCCADRAFT_88890 [Bipolaris zeicola 26-R-13]|uniref:Uncharacterized protein n=1 Tax=Cochliobolus carbonum (strain 26-R-13) TaxID=930089 RepID=W6YEV2_COCC2|nr:uncharacterized protein COCCADRAFT_88890 [Bipolaris zeicola 26-R-13]EUC36175.1 hypothetical protein COCCADRAFT_88890 [Bipolaris zeicola 26-R-13]